MSNGNSTAAAAKPAAKKSSTPPAQIAEPTHVPALFRKIDWAAFLLTTLIVFAGYLWTLAPEMTLEDSGELAVGSLYAGIPHPPGYPVWTIYTHLFQKLVPIGNIAYRVGMASALAGALASGLLALLVSRGSSMMIEGIEGLEKLERRTENLICLVSGYTAGFLIGFNSYMWSQAVIVEVYPFGVLSLMGVLLCLLRWIYAPHQRRYLYGALFLFGVCFTNHQSLLAAAMGIEIAIAVGQPKLGRDMFFGNAVIYIAYNLMVATGHVVFQNLQGGMMHHLFHAVGLGSIVGCIWLTIKTEKILTEWKAVLILGIAFLVGASFYFYMPLAGMSTPPMQWGYPRTVEGFIHALTRGQYEQPHPTDIFADPFRVVMQLGILLGGVSDEFGWIFTALALVPFLYFFKMQRRERAWLVGVFAIYLCLGPLLMILFNLSPDRSAISLTKVFFTASHVMISLLAGYGATLVMASLSANFPDFRSIGLIGGIAAVDFAVLTVIAAVQKLHCGTTSVEADDTLIWGRWKLLCWLLIGFCVYLSRRPSQEHNRPILKVGIILGGTATIVMTALALHGNPYAQPNVSGLGNFLHTFMAAFNPDQFALPLFAGLIMLALTLVFLVLVCINRTRLPLMLLVLIFAVAPTNSFLCHWFDNEQRGHLFGYWFGHDMFTPPFNAKDGKPLYPEMARHAILYGGTDPGRFAPTYMIFDESFTPAEKKIDPKFDRRDVYIITQNALADGTYLMYIRSHYNRSSQKAMGMDVPFFQELTRTKSDREEYKTNAISKLLSKPLDTFFTGVGETIEKDRRVGTSYFKPEVFTDLKKFTARLSAHSTAFDKQLFDGLSASTKSLLNGGNETQLRAALAADLNKLLDAGFYDDKEIVKLVEDRYPAVAEWEKAKARRRELTQGQSPEALAQVTPSLDSAVAIGQQRVSALTEKIQSAADAIAANLTANGVPLTPRLKKFIAEAPHQPRNFTKVRLMRQLVEAAFPQEIAVSLGGVYPDLEMYISTPEDSAQCFADYMADAGERARRGQLKPGENVSVEGGKLQVSGQVAVMSINGYISKNMFDQNPDNEFYVEESFPMDWMYDYITPFGVIMKVNRQPLAEISQEICDRDHEFWSQYSARFIGNWITYDTSVKDVCDWAEKTYLRHDFSGFKGDRAFVRDDSGQKAFSKLRSSIASSIYVHRAGKSKNNIEQARMIKEADFALKQAYAYCPYSPEAVYNYVSLLANTGRGTDALLIASTALKLDPYNDSFKGLVKNLEGYSSNQIPPLPAKDKLAETLGKMEADFKANPENFQNAFDLSAAYHQLGRTNDAFAVLKKISDSPKADAGVLLVVAQANAAMNDFPALEKTLARILVLAPDDPENHYNVAALKSVLGKKEEALAAFAKCAELNAPRLAKNPKARDLVTAAQTDDRFAPIRDTPEFKKLIGK